MMEKIVVLLFLAMAAVLSSMSVKALNHSYESGRDLASFEQKSPVMPVPSVWFKPFGAVEADTD